jgi:hypothetical protein
MPSQDASKIKESILKFLRMKGPSLPIHISQEIKLSALFTSAFLSELFSERGIKMSYLRVGSSPVYFLSGQEKDLEKFSSHLKSKEKEAFLLLKEEKILRDQEQEPAIRVAIRSIKDFAIPFEKEKELYWKYFLVDEKDFLVEEKEIEPSPIIEVAEEPEETREEETEMPKPVPEKSRSKKSQKKKPAKTKEKSKKGNDKFLARVKEFLSKENIEIIDIEGFSKEGIILKIRTNGEEKAFIAYNKKKIEERDLINAHKKAKELGLGYIVLSLGESSKKMNELIDAVRNLSGMEKME